MALLDDLLAHMRDTPELSDIQVVENEAVDDETFQFKVRATIVPNFLQIRFLADKDLKRYSFQLYSNHPLLRWDNSPHYPDLPNRPHHFHNQDNDVTASSLTGNLLADFDIVIAEIKKFMNLV
ncbi:MAG: hypothetical protein HZB17_00100 [Chloroflexi bacterium]|nr:hypothetical protein [Chloroflexota bacterium]MBI5079694.1 hypothetical protein [Chloroflexota bacterium]